MDYRIKYRDLPWSVAFGAFFGKIIGTFIIKPANWYERGMKRAKPSALIITVVLVIAIATTAILIVDCTIQPKDKALIHRIWEASK